MSFAVRAYGDVAALVYEPWERRGISHGFTLAPADFGAAGAPLWGPRLCGAFRAESLALLQQEHGSVCVELEAGEAQSLPPSGDAFFVADSLGGRRIVGVKAADCVPILVCADSARVLIHAGWRGLANGIIPKALSRVAASSAVECVVGPCAGPEGYEVGAEVAAAIGAAAATESAPGGKAYLDLGETARRIILSSLPQAAVTLARVNSVADRRFHSHRRDGGAAGRNLGFFLV